MKSFEQSWLNILRLIIYKEYCSKNDFKRRPFEHALKKPKTKYILKQLLSDYIYHLNKLKIHSFL